jgi:hypothetical protein
MMRGLIAQTYEGMYGDGDRRAGVDGQLCASVIEHSHGFCEHLVEQDDELSGCITDLTTQAQPHQPDVDEDVEAEVDPFPGAWSEEDTESWRAEAEAGQRQRF